MSGPGFITGLPWFKEGKPVFGSGVGCGDAVATCADWADTLASRPEEMQVTIPPLSCFSGDPPEGTYVLGRTMNSAGVSIWRFDFESPFPTCNAEFASRSASHIHLDLGCDAVAFPNGPFFAGITIHTFSGVNIHCARWLKELQLNKSELSAFIDGGSIPHLDGVCGAGSASYAAL